jgi:hypothetical protein
MTGSGRAVSDAFPNSIKRRSNSQKANFLTARRLAREFHFRCRPGKIFGTSDAKATISLVCAEQRPSMREELPGLAKRCAGALFPLPLRCTGVDRTLSSGGRRNNCQTAGPRAEFSFRQSMLRPSTRNVQQQLQLRARQAYGCTAFCWALAAFQFLNRMAPWTGDQPVARPLPTHRLPCLEWDSNPRAQRQFVPPRCRQVRGFVTASNAHFRRAPAFSEVTL